MKPSTHLTRYIRARRLELGLTQAAVAKHFGYAPQFVTNWEHGVSRPPEHVLPKLCKILKVKPWTLYELATRDSDDHWKAVFFKKEAAFSSAQGG